MRRIDEGSENTAFRHLDVDDVAEIYGARQAVRARPRVLFADFDDSTARGYPLVLEQCDLLFGSNISP
jgi:hypothetical protein